MYTRVYKSDGNFKYLTHDSYFDIQDLEPYETYVSGLQEKDLYGLELARLIDIELESANMHSLCGIGEKVYAGLQAEQFSAYQILIVLRLLQTNLGNI